MRFLSIALFFILNIASNNLLAHKSSEAQETRWKQIVVLRSARDDVERLLGKSQSPGYDGVYHLKEGHLFVLYTALNFCEYGKDFGWNVPEGTVVEVTFRPDPMPQFSTLNLDLKRFKEVRESPCCPDLITFRNDEEGVAYTVNPSGTLNTIEYFPSSQYDHLRCRKQSGTP